MPLKTTQLKKKHPRRRKRRKRRRPISTLWGFMGKCWDALRGLIRAVLALPPIVRVFLIPAFLLILWGGLNLTYQAFNKPSELLFPLDRSLNKHPIETWKHYESLFREHATSVITPEFLAALAQVEAAGNPLARTYWRWQLTWNPLEWYRPASSAVGMFQITDGTFMEAKRYCIHDHVVVEDGPWHDRQSCWFNSFYTRVIPSHAIEMTAALLDRQVMQTMRSQKLSGVTLQKKQDLAAVIHLCGAGTGRAYAARRFQLITRQRCGDHDVRKYLTRMNSLKKSFINPTTRDKTIRQAR